MNPLPRLAIIRRGETFATTCAPRQAGESVRAALKPAGPQRTVPAAATPDTVLFTVTDSTVGADPAWTLALTPAQTAQLEPGEYVFDVRITMPGGAVQITDPVAIMVTDAVTGP